MNLPSEVLKIFQFMKSKGRQAFLAGGAVRDHFLNRTPKDYDWAIDASQEELLEWIPNTVPNWFGVKFRNEGKYHMDIMPMMIHIKPFERTSSIIDDLKTRGVFTFSTMAYNPDIGFLDPNNGKEDLLNGIMRLNAAMGLSEEEVLLSDPGLILKAISLSYRLGIMPDKHLKELFLKHRHRLETEWCPKNPEWVQRHISRARQLGTDLAKEILGF
jgi:tRNA nucleotidyltransferase/poly(A) polymerase